jgi:RNA polymerase sigma factor (sigma-70 family)
MIMISPKNSTTDELAKRLMTLLVTLHHGRFLGFARKLCYRSNAEDFSQRAEDVVSDAYASLFGELKTRVAVLDFASVRMLDHLVRVGDIVGALAIVNVVNAMVYKYILNSFFNTARKARRRGEESQLNEEIESRTSNQSDRTNAAMEVSLLRKSLSHSDMLLVEYHADGFSADEIAAMFGVKVDTMQRRITRAREKARKVIERANEEPMETREVDPMIEK